MHLVPWFLSGALVLVTATQATPPDCLALVAMGLAFPDPTELWQSEIVLSRLPPPGLCREQSLCADIYLLFLVRSALGILGQFF